MRSCLCYLNGFRHKPPNPNTLVLLGIRWELMESAAGIANFTEVNGMDAVHYTFSEAAANGMTVVRMFGHGINSTLALQPSPGMPHEMLTVTKCKQPPLPAALSFLAGNDKPPCCTGKYNETAFEGLDLVIDAAAQYGIRLIITLSDSWNLVDSIKSVCPGCEMAGWLHISHGTALTACH